MKDETRMPVSSLRVQGKYLQAMARHDDSMERITSTLLNAQSCWPAPLSKKVVTEALASLSELQGKARVGLGYRLDDEKTDAVEMEFEQAVCGGLAGNDRPKAAKHWGIVV